MNTFSVVWYPPEVSSAPFPSAMVVAKEFVFDQDYVLFMDESTPPEPVFVVPHDLSPVITRLVVAVADAAPSTAPATGVSA